MADRKFKASTGWLEKFKTRHGIRNLSIQGEKLSAAEETVEPFLQKLHKVVKEKNLIPEQIYNADETGLLWKCLPQRTLVSCREKSAPGFKKAKDRLTVLGCTNATGTHKLKPVLIGKSAKPRYFKHVNMDALPVIYKSQRNAWMNSEIFAEFREDNIAESMVLMLEHVQQLDNEEMPNARDVEDWLNLENELPTSPQMSDEEILATVVGDSTESESVCSDEEDEGEDKKLVSTKEAAQCLKKCLSWMESQNDIDPVQLMQLRRMMDFAMRSSYKVFEANKHA